MLGAAALPFCTVVSAPHFSDGGGINHCQTSDPPAPLTETTAEVAGSNSQCRSGPWFRKGASQSKCLRGDSALTGGPGSGPLLTLVKMAFTTHASYHNITRNIWILWKTQAATSHLSVLQSVTYGYKNPHQTLLTAERPVCGTALYSGTAPTQQNARLDWIAVPVDKDNRYRRLFVSAIFWHDFFFLLNLHIFEATSCFAIATVSLSAGVAHLCLHIANKNSFQKPGLPPFTRSSIVLENPHCPTAQVTLGALGRIIGSPESPRRKNWKDLWTLDHRIVKRQSVQMSKGCCRTE